jgi:uncharacterized C2H2 Zn-finger protein
MNSCCNKRFDDARAYNRHRCELHSDIKDLTDGNGNILAVITRDADDYLHCPSPDCNFSHYNRTMFKRHVKNLHGFVSLSQDTGATNNEDGQSPPPSVYVPTNNSFMSEPDGLAQVEPTVGLAEIEPTVGLAQVEPTVGLAEVEPTVGNIGEHIYADL